MIVTILEINKLSKISLIVHYSSAVTSTTEVYRSLIVTICFYYIQQTSDNQRNDYFCFLYKTERSTMKLLN